MSTPLACVVAHILANIENLTDEQLRHLHSHIGYELQDREVSHVTDTQEKARFVNTIMGW